MSSLPPNPLPSNQPPNPQASFAPTPPGLGLPGPQVHEIHGPPSHAAPPIADAGSSGLMLKIGIAAAVALVIGLVIGFIAGRITLERKWAQPYATVTPAEENKWSSEDADPAPKAGSRILKPMPLAKSRAALATMTANDPAFSPTASVGQGEEGVELHVTIENRGKCKITNVGGVAYGFDAVGIPAMTNKHGEPFVFFTKLEKPIEPGQHAMLAMKLRYADAATIAVAHIDSTECADGTSWKRN